MKTLIAIPCMDYMDTRFVRSLVSMQRVGNTCVSFLTNTLIYDARNKLAQQAIDENVDYVLWLDSDVVFNESLLIDLFKAIEGRDFVTGVYHKRRPPYSPVIYKTIRLGIGADAYSEEYLDYPKNSIFEIDACGFGAVLMRAEMLKTVVNKDNALFSPIAGYGEDISFCIRARRAGYKLYCDSSIQLGHVAQTIVTSDTYKAFNMTRKE